MTDPTQITIIVAAVFSSFSMIFLVSFFVSFRFWFFLSQIDKRLFKIKISSMTIKLYVGKISLVEMAIVIYSCLFLTQILLNVGAAVTSQCWVEQIANFAYLSSAMSSSVLGLVVLLAVSNSRYVVRQMKVQKIGLAICVIIPLCLFIISVSCGYYPTSYVTSPSE